MTLATSLVHAGCFQRQAALSPGLAPGLQLPLRRRLGMLYSGFARPRVLYELPYTMEQLSDREELRQALWSDPLRTRAFTSRFLLEVFRMQRFVRRNIVTAARAAARLAGREGHDGRQRDCSARS